MTGIGFGPGCSHVARQLDDCPYCRCAELEGQRNTFRNLAKLTDKKHTALVDAIEVLADQMENEGPTNRTWYIELRGLALLPANKGGKTQ